MDNQDNLKYDCEDFSALNIQEMYNLLTDGQQLPEASHKRGTFYTSDDSFNPDHKKTLALKEVVKDRVLEYLPAKSLFRFKAVCKDWNQWINRPLFVNRQCCKFQKKCGFFYQCPDTFPIFISSDSTAYGVASPSFDFLPEYVTLRATCNGLICCQAISGDNNYYICNPSNKEWHVIPQPSLYHGPESALVLVYQPATLNFKASYEMVCAVPMINEPTVRFEIFSSRSRSWRIVDSVCSELSSTKLCGDGFFMKGYAYWETHSGEVLAFDMCNEMHSTFPLPANRGPEGVLTECRGQLSYIMPYKLENDECLIEVYGGMDMSLKDAVYFPIGKFIDEENECMRALPCLSGGKFAVLVGWDLVVYDVKENNAQSLNLRGIYGGGKFLPYVNNMVPVSHHQMYKEIVNASSKSDKTKASKV